jgi:DNA replication protein DnaC
MDANLLLESHLKTLRLTTFREQYRQVADDATRNDLSYDRYLLALAEQEVAQRQLSAQRQRIKAARFPVLKELADFDFSVIPQLNKQRVLDLARGEYLTKKAHIILVGTPCGRRD